MWPQSKRHVLAGTTGSLLAVHFILISPSEWKARFVDSPTRHLMAVANVAASPNFSSSIADPHHLRHSDNREYRVGFYDPTNEVQSLPSGNTPSSWLKSFK